METGLASLFVISLVVALVLVPWVRRRSERIGFLDHPSRRSRRGVREGACPGLAGHFAVLWWPL